MPKPPAVEYPEEVSFLERMVVLAALSGAAYAATRPEPGLVGTLGLVVVFALTFFRPSGLWRTR